MNNKRLHNFGAGPCILPREVLDQAAEAVVYWPKARLSLLEVSHRHAAFEEVVEETKSLTRELLRIPDGYEILFLQGGASTQFTMMPMNFLSQDRFASFLDTGFFSQKAMHDVGVFGKVHCAASSADRKYKYVPLDYDIPAGAAYFHITSNNTIEGTQMKHFPDSPVRLFCDMSSDIFSREIDVKKFDMIYAGAQKNMGPAGMTLIIMKKDLLEESNTGLGTMMDYKVHVTNGSIYNTPPVFAIYTAMLNLRWLKAKGGIRVQEKENEAKANHLYTALDQSPIFHGFADRSSRSIMNVTFSLPTEELENSFLEFAALRDIAAIKGYHTIGGFRASLYNALSIESVAVLAEAIEEFSYIHAATPA